MQNSLFLDESLLRPFYEALNVNDFDKLCGIVVKYYLFNEKDIGNNIEDKELELIWSLVKNVLDKNRKKYNVKPTGQQIQDYIIKHPDATGQEVADFFGCEVKSF